MLEVAILDTLEQVANATTSVISDIKATYSVVGAPTVSGSVAEFLHYYTGQALPVSTIVSGSVQRFKDNGVTTGNQPMWLSGAGIWMISYAGSSSVAKAVSYAPATNVWAVEATTTKLENPAEDNTGVVWAISQAAGLEGLYKRVSAGSWTRVVVSSTFGSALVKASNGSLYYRDSSSTTWYLVAGGIVTLLGVGVGFDPEAGKVIGGQNWYFSFWGRGAGGDVKYIQKFPGVDGDYPQQADATSTVIAAGFTDKFNIFAVPQNTRVMSKPSKIYEDAASYAASGNQLVMQVAGSVYSLWVNCNLLNGNAEYSATLVNPVTGSSQVIGSWKAHCPTTGGWGGGALGTVLTLVPGMARLSNGILQVYSIGYIPAATGGCGYLRHDITARITI